MTDELIKIQLTGSELLQGVQVGAMRHIRNLVDGIPFDREGCPIWQDHIEGALAELAFAKWRGVYWAGTGKKGGCDVGNEDVRCGAEHHYQLILHPNDPDDRKYWLLTGEYGRYVLRGYIYGRDGKKPEYWKEYIKGRPAFFVPQNALIFDE